jgi:hypothetical protein
VELKFEERNEIENFPKPISTLEDAKFLKKVNNSLIF